MEKPCAVCGKIFKVRPRGGSYCSTACVGLKNRAPEKPCVICGILFHAHHGDKKTQCCSRTCSAKYAWQLHREIMLENTVRAAEARQTPEAQAKMRRWQHAPDNPIYNPIVIRKRDIAARERGYAHLTGGGGSQLTLPQKLLAVRLAWETEVSIPTNQNNGRARTRTMKATRPFCYRLDIAEPLLKINIEVDGNSHLSTRVKTRDARRDMALTALGWTVLRFTNKQVIADLEAVVCSVMGVVRSITSKPQQETILPKKS